MIKAFGRALILASLLADVQAGELAVYVKNENGQPVKDAVVFAKTLVGNRTNSSASTEKPRTTTIAQINKQFVPYVSAVQIGTAVSFPNKDDILHNVYSFSKAKKFQLPLYKDEAPEPVTFDKPGVVILGCNIHDWMVAYIYVLDTPYFAKTGSNGRAELKGLPVGEYRVQVRHPRKRKRGSSPALRILVGLDDARQQSRFVIALKPEWRPQQVEGAN
ncbi:MAG: methylamine utilization protein [Gammaproteobacteria bacterium]